MPQLAILTARDCVVPLGTKQPTSRNTLILKDLEATIVLATNKHATRFNKLDIHTVNVNEDFINGLLPTETVSGPATADILVFIIYTSGSTDVPNGAILPHSGFCASLQHMAPRSDSTRVPALFDSQHTPLIFLFWVFTPHGTMEIALSLCLFRTGLETWVCYGSIPGQLRWSNINISCTHSRTGCGISQNTSIPQ